MRVDGVTGDLCGLVDRLTQEEEADERGVADLIRSW